MGNVLREERNWKFEREKKFTRREVQNVLGVEKFEMYSGKKWEMYLKERNGKSILRKEMGNVFRRERRNALKGKK